MGNEETRIIRVEEAQCRDRNFIVSSNWSFDKYGIVCLAVDLKAH